jgi:hypothetical protein
VTVKLRLLVLLLLICAFCAWPTVGRAQSAFISGSAGLSAGDGGAAPAITIAAGYLTPRRIGFEVEFGFTPDLDFPTPDFVIQSPTTEIFPPLVFESTGRILTLHTNVLFPLTTSGRLRVLALGGGGVGSVREHRRVQREAIVLTPGFPTIPGFEVPPFSSPALDVTTTVTDTALSLNLGGVIEYAVTDRLGVGVDARYGHVFLDRNGLDMGRITGRMSWRF